MKFKSMMTAAALALAGTAAIAPLPAAAQGHGWNDRGGYDQGYQDVAWRGDRGYRDGGYNGRRYYGNDHRYRGNRRCYDKGNGGLAIGGIAGGLAGNALAGRGDRTVGTILGAGVGALAGRAIDRSDGRPC